MESILTSIKKMLGIAEEYTHFDPELVVHINSVFMILRQLGIGPESGFSIDDASATWSSFSEDMSKIELIKSYMYLKIRLLFDPPINSSVTESFNKQIAEYEWRLNVEVDPKMEVNNGSI